MVIKTRFLLLALLFVSQIAGATKVVAHRGAWNETIPQNSIASLHEAARLGVYGAEFDVHFTSDNVPVIFHDDSIQGRSIQHSTYAELQSIRLSNGEALPTLQHYFEAALQHPDLVLFLEIKSHYSTERNREVAALLLKFIKKQKLHRPIEVITFSTAIGDEMLRLDRKIRLHYLDSDVPYEELAKRGYTGVDLHHSIYTEHPEYMKRFSNLKLKTNAWTVNSSDLMRYLVQLKVDYITTDHPAELLKLLRK